MAFDPQSAVDYISNFEGIYLKLLVALIILLAGAIIGKLLGRLVRRILREIELDNILNKAIGRKVRIERIIASFIRYIIYFITIIMVLNQLNVTTTVLQMIVAAVIIVVIISAVLAIKDFVPNAFAGLYIYKKRMIKEGDRIRVKGIEGHVLHINLVETKLQTKEGDSVYLPNSSIIKSEITKVKGRKKK